MKNIHVLLTDKPSRLSIDDGIFNLHRQQWRKGGQNIYITSDEEIKEGDWFLDIFSNKIIKSELKLENNGRIKKITLTTDFSLAPDVQKIDDEFLEWFVKNQSCEEVDVVYGFFNPMGRQVDPNDLGQNHSKCVWKYKIIIPKEEPKQETLERAAERLYSNDGYFDELYCDIGEYNKEKFIEGAKWNQERSYSEEEVIDLLRARNIELGYYGGSDEIEEWFEQFKKK